MTDDFATLDQAADSPAQVISKLIDLLRSQHNYHQLFDALLLQKKQEWGLPLAHPTSFEDVPDAKKAEFEQAYIAAAREVGGLLLQEKQIGQAWLYFRTIREPQPVIHAIESLDVEQPPPDEIVDIALYQGVAPAKGLEFLLKHHGTCNSVTALDQHLRQLTPEHRQACAALMVRQIYGDLRESVAMDVERRTNEKPLAELSLVEILQVHPELLAEDNYHIDVSHLHAITRFARSLTPSDPEMPLARQLAEYGARLAPQYQYAGDPPFESYYPAHIHYFSALIGDRREEALRYFEENLQAQTQDIERQLSALGLVELLMRLQEYPRAAELAIEHLANVQEQIGFSLADLCLQAKRPDLLQKLARNRQDLVGYATSLLLKS